MIAGKHILNNNNSKKLLKLFTLRICAKGEQVVYLQHEQNIKDNGIGIDTL